MSENYSKISNLWPNLYVSDSPILICGGEVRKAKTSGKIVNMLQLRSLSKKVIKSVEVELVGQNSLGVNVGNRVYYTYADLNVKEGQFFAADVDVEMSSPLTYMVYVYIKKVTFDDETIWDGTGKYFDLITAPKVLVDDEYGKKFKSIFGAQCKNYFSQSSNYWTCPCGHYNSNADKICSNCGISYDKLKDIKQLPEVLADNEYRKEYRAIYGEQCKFAFTQYDKYWGCPCGHINDNDDAKCPSCGLTYANLTKTTDDEINKRTNERLEKENKVKEKENKEKTIRNKKLMKMGGIVGGIAAAVLIAVFVVTNIVLPSMKYNEALSYVEDCDIVSAMSTLEQIDNYSKYSQRDDFIDAVATAIPEMINDDEQMDAVFSLAGSYELDEYKNPLFYATALASADIGETDYAIYLLELVGDYEDAEDLIDELEDRLEEEDAAQTELDYLAAMELFENGEYEAAKEVFDEIEDHADAADYAYVCALVDYQNQYATLMENYEKGTYNYLSESFETLIKSVNTKYKYATDSFNALCETLGMDNFEVLRADAYSAYISLLINYSDDDDAIISAAEEIGFTLQKEKSTYSSNTYTYWQIAGFTDTDATYVNIPETIDSIAQYAFSKCTKLEEVSIPYSFTSLDKLIFDNTPWLNNMKDEIVIVGDGLLFFYPDVTTTTGEIVIQDGVKYINNELFKDGVMDSVVFPDSLVKIGYGAFMNCVNLVEVNVPEGVAYIGGNAFYSCDILVTATLPSTLEFLDDDSFDACPELEEITINQTEEELSIFVSFANQNYTVNYLDPETEEE